MDYARVIALATVPIVAWLYFSRSDPSKAAQNLSATTEQSPGNPGADCNCDKKVTRAISQSLSKPRPNLPTFVGMATNDTWRIHRKAITKVLGPPFVRKAFIAAVSKSKQLIQIWNDELSKNNAASFNVEIQGVLSGLILDILFTTVSSRDIRFLEEHETGTETVQYNVKTFLRAFFLRAVAPKWLYSVLKIQPQDLWLVNSHLDKVVHRIIDNANLEENELLAKFRDELVGLLIAGHDTTSNTITNMFLALGQNKHVLDKLRREIDAAFPKGEPLTVEGLERLPYLDSVLRETQRRYPVVSAVVRVSAKPVEVLGYKFPAGTRFATSFKGSMVLNEEIFGPNLGKFDPDRFSTATNVIDDSTFTPFGAGIHKCPGHKMAILESKIVLVMLLQSFDFEIVANQPPLSHVIGFTTSLKNGLMLRVSKRNQ
ncbi:cytochrome P450 [Obelidium mucronatum]|nr:cytochrome P450 [Obelidium mucronatum]